MSEQPDDYNKDHNGHDLEEHEKDSNNNNNNSNGLTEEKDEEDIKIDRETDILVIGSGIAGGNLSLCLAGAGFKVLVPSI